MKVRAQFLLVVLPLIVVSLALSETASYFNAANGVTRLARQLLGFKLGELEKYAGNQWALLVENGYAGRPDMVDAAKKAVELYGRSIVLSDTEVILALDENGAPAMASSPFEIKSEERGQLMELLRAESSGPQNAVIGGEKRIFQSFYFTPFQWFILISEKSEVFYRDANRIALQTLITLGVSIAAAALLLAVVSAHLTNPLGRVVKAMNNIINSADLSSRVEVEYQDETGRLAHTFNQMIGELDKAYGQIKRYAFEAVLAGKKEERVRQIFQKYVPKDVLERFFASPEKMLVGDNRYLSILFSDIRSFTAISEGMPPNELVGSLNRYFSGQVDIIYNRQGVVDKYIGDAIMAFWGAPERHTDDALQSVLSGLDMLDALALFNENQRKLGKPEFRVGIGINYGEATVGNIGSDRKMEYTVIGDAVNLASRMEGLTKIYQVQMLISGDLYQELRRQPPGSAATTRLFFRHLDTVAVQGKRTGVPIYTVKRALSPAEAAAWPLHNEGMELYYRRSFREGAEKFREVYRLLPKDFNAETMFRRCAEYAAHPPPEGWDGVEVMKTK
ncbi:MAG: adenylate/guanylate cyclase domain-containing protein [Spirochaetaceae bacterium]|jgi:class 3 adenylate cyclase/HAMP domain-containing protein|nr:adenylate/guanylate cyclase domain-containing protein [Spirochaetaceae bacterium]